MMPKVHLWVDYKKCVGCRICELICSLTHENVFRPSISRIKVHSIYPRAEFPVVCRQCSNPSCVEACPTGALRKDEVHGAIMLDAGVCIKCRACIEACPFKCITLHPAKETPIVCDLCKGKPVCVELCPSGALKFTRTDREIMTQQRIVAANSIELRERRIS